MVLYRFFFAPALLAIAVLAGRMEKAQPPAPAPPIERAVVRAADPVQPGAAAQERARPARSARSVPRAVR